MLQLRYSLKQDKYQYATLLGDPDSIRHIYWQLTHNYKPQDGTAIGEIKVLTLDGTEVTGQVMRNPHGCRMALSNLEA